MENPLKDPRSKKHHSWRVPAYGLLLTHLVGPQTAFQGEEGLRGVAAAPGLGCRGAAWGLWWPLLKLGP